LLLFCSIEEAFKSALGRREVAFPVLEGVDMNRLKNPAQLASLFKDYNR